MDVQLWFGSLTELSCSLSATPSSEQIPVPCLEELLNLQPVAKAHVFQGVSGFCLHDKPKFRSAIFLFGTCRTTPMTLISANGHAFLLLCCYVKPLGCLNPLWSKGVKEIYFNEYTQMTIFILLQHTQTVLV